MVPRLEGLFYRDEKSPGAERAMEAMLRMKKINLAELQRAYEGAA